MNSIHCLMLFTVCTALGLYDSKDDVINIKKSK